MNSPANDILSITQTAFVPGRDIVDNVLHHLEEVDWLECPSAVDGRQGCLVFLDFEKAYDRVDRGWLMRCLQHMGFREGCCRWVQVLLAGTGAQVLVNGFRTRRIALTSGVAQGSPLSPLLFNICQQPLASYMQHLQGSAAIRGIPLPDGHLAPPTHQHADDTVLHLLGLDDLPPALQGVQLFCAATNARLNVDKTQGMLLGAHPDVASDDGVHAATGVRFVRRGEFVRHLGVLLARPADQAAAATAMHDLRLKQLYAVVRQWAPFALSFVGRLYIAKQCMASVLYYHAQFVRPAQAQLNTIVAVIARFVARTSPSDAAEDPRAYMIHPSLAVASLPREDGGLAAVDVRTQLDALQAKIVARLVHPRRHPWKAIMEAAITECAPAHLGVALPFFMGAPLPRRPTGGRPAMLQRHSDYVAAMRRMVPHRSCPAKDMSQHAVLVEPFLDNACIRLQHSRLPATVHTLPPPALRSIQQHGIRRLRDLRRAYLARPDDPGLMALVQLLPPLWQHHVTRLDTAPSRYYCHTAGQYVATTLGFGTAQCQVYTIQDDGRLSEEAAHAPPAPLSAVQDWHPCCVVYVNKPVALMTRAEREAIQVQLRAGAPRESVLVAKVAYLVGPWSSLSICPTGWALGTRGLLDFAVRLAALRARRLRAADKVPGFALGNGVFPKSWEPAGGGGGLQAVESRWVVILQQRQGQPAGTDEAGPSNAVAAQEGRRRRQYAQGWAPAPWLRDTFTFDQHDLDLADDTDLLPAATPAGSQPEADGIGRRVQARREAQAAVRAGPLALHPPPPPPAPLADHIDLAAPAPGRVPPVARKAWERLMSPRLPRDYKALAWRVMHASLYTGVFWAYVTGRGASHAACCSPSCKAAGLLDTMQHLFLECPDVQAAAQWLVRLWGAVSPTGPPPCTAAVLLAGDDRVWQPGGEESHDELWTTLRLSWLHAVWSLRCRRLLDPERSPVTAAGVVAATVAAVTRLMRRDYARTVGDARCMSTAPRSWFRGTVVPTLAVDGFLKRWGANGVLCSVSPGNAEGQGRQLVVHLTVATPVALL
jgi:hypothetical protein